MPGVIALRLRSERQRMCHAGCSRSSSPLGATKRLCHAERSRGMTEEKDAVVDP